MSPTCSNRDLAGRNALSATDLTNFPLLLSRAAYPGRAAPYRPEGYVMAPRFATYNRHFRVPGGFWASSGGMPWKWPSCGG
jgi:hypothetical protein